MTEERKNLSNSKVLTLWFQQRKKNVNKAINDVSFHIYEGETFGLVGESGSGKTTIGRAIMKLYDINKGEIHFNGNDVSKIKGAELKNSVKSTNDFPRPTSLTEWQNAGQRHHR